MTRSVDDLAADLRPGLVGGCAYECGCDDPGNPQKCVHAGRFAALSELVALAERASRLALDRDICLHRAVAAEAALADMRRALDGAAKKHGPSCRCGHWACEGTEGGA